MYLAENGSNASSLTRSSGEFAQIYEGGDGQDATELHLLSQVVGRSFLPRGLLLRRGKSELWEPRSPPALRCQEAELAPCGMADQDNPLPIGLKSEVVWPKLWKSLEDREDVLERGWPVRAFFETAQASVLDIEGYEAGVLHLAREASHELC